MKLCMYLCTDHLVICGQLENCTLTFVCPLALKDKLGGLHHSLVTNCLKDRCIFFVFNEVTTFCTSCFKIVFNSWFSILLLKNQHPNYLLKAEVPVIPGENHTRDWFFQCRVRWRISWIWIVLCLITQRNG